MLRSTANACTASSKDALSMINRYSLSSTRNPTLRTLKSGVTVFKAVRPYSRLSQSLPVSTSALSICSKRSLRGTRAFSTSSNLPSPHKAAIFSLVDRIHEHHYGLLEDIEELGLLSLFPETSKFFDLQLTDEFITILGHPTQESLWERVRLARQQHGEVLPEGELTAEELVLYTSLYGKPIVSSEVETGDLEKVANKLFRDDGQGGLVEVELGLQSEDIVEEPITSEEVEYEPLDPKTLEQRMREVGAQIDGEVIDNYVSDLVFDETPRPRAHPLTTSGKYGTFPSTVFMPAETLIEPIKEILSHHKKPHIQEAAYEKFDPSLSKSTSTTSKCPQEPIPLSAAQHDMPWMDVNLFLAVLYPAMYATSLSVLSEVRKRLGAKWLRDLMHKEGGPRILDTGAGGAGILAWRDVLKAEWSLMYPDHPADAQIPQGRASVLAGSDTLKARVSKFLDNTTFLPRLPDYLHMRDQSVINDGESQPHRKQFDIIIASHALMRFPEDYMRRDYVQNLWSLLNPDGGVLILVEKGIPRGFDVISGAREMILEKLIASPGSPEYEKMPGSSSEGVVIQKDKGMIIAPCTNHSKCPMHVTQAVKSSGRSICRFSQRFIRPPFLQRLKKDAMSNHEDVDYSYLAVQRGVDQRETQGIIQGESAADAAFRGYEAALDNSGNFGVHDFDAMDSSVPQLNPLSLPRVVFPPLKRKGHVVLDLCTPAGKIERWTVPRSFSKQAYRDARKSGWGDLWALGAKTRVPRNLKIAVKEREVFPNRAARKRMAREERNDLDKDMEEADPLADLDINIPDFEQTMDKFSVRRAQKPKKRVDLSESIEDGEDRKELDSAFLAERDLQLLNRRRKKKYSSDGSEKTPPWVSKMVKHQMKRRSQGEE